MSDISQFFVANKELDESALGAAYEHQQSLLKHEGALGKLDEYALRLASMQGRALPELSNVYVAIFAADHGIAQHDISSQEVDSSAHKLNALVNGQGAATLMASESVQFELIDCGINTSLVLNPSILNEGVASSTQDFSVTSAMTGQQMFTAMSIGFVSVERAIAANAEIFIAGELGRGNSTSAVAMAAVLSGKSVAELVGDGSGIGFRQRKLKTELIEKSIALHQAELNSPLKILQTLGGFEIAALCGAYIRCAQLGLPILVDGMICTVAVWVADLISRNDQLAHCKSEEALWKLGKYSIPETMFCTCGSCPRLVDWCFFSHQSSEPAHEVLLDILAVEPILNLEMNLGEASGAMLALPILQSACRLHKDLAPQTLQSL